MHRRSCLSSRRCAQLMDKKALDPPSTHWFPEVTIIDTRRLLVRIRGVVSPFGKPAHQSAGQASNSTGLKPE